MKLSLILVSVNLAATLPIAVAGMANAAEQAKSDKADWLKSSLAQMDAVATPKRALQAKALSLSMPEKITPQPRVKLRPFVPGRRLPTQHELDVQLIAQNARMAAVRQQPDLIEQTASMAPGSETLTGRVSEVYPVLPKQVATYGNVGYVKQSSSRVVPNQVAAAPGQIRQFKGAKRTKYVPTGPAQNSIAQPAQEESWTADYPTLGQAMSSQGGQSGSLLQQPQSRFLQQPLTSFGTTGLSPGITPDEQAIIDRMVAQTRAQSQSAETAQMGALSSHAGPPPFPLNLLPPDALKSIIGGMRKPGAVAQTPPASASYFGSYHGAQSSSLASGGAFQMHPPVRNVSPLPVSAQPQRSNFMSTAYGASGVSRAHHVAHSTHSTTAQAKHLRTPQYSSAYNSSSSTQSLAQVRRLAPQEMHVAAYPPYPRLSGAY